MKGVSSYMKREEGTRVRGVLCEEGGGEERKSEGAREMRVFKHCKGLSVRNSCTKPTMGHKETGFEVVGGSAREQEEGETGGRFG